MTFQLTTLLFTKHLNIKEHFKRQTIDFWQQEFRSSLCFFPLHASCVKTFTVRFTMSLGYLHWQEREGRGWGLGRMHSDLFTTNGESTQNSLFIGPNQFSLSLVEITVNELEFVLFCKSPSPFYARAEHSSARRHLYLSFVVCILYFVFCILSSCFSRRGFIAWEQHHP